MKGKNMKTTKNIEVNENILTLYNVINVMYYNYCSELPIGISKDIEKLLSNLTEYLEKDFLDLDIYENKLIREVTFMEKD